MYAEKVAAFKCISSKQVKKCDRKSHFEKCPYARTSARTVPNPFRTHFRMHIDLDNIDRTVTRLRLWRFNLYS